VFVPSRKLTALAAAATIAAAGAGQALGAAPASAPTPPDAGAAKAAIIERPDDRFDRAPVVDHYRTAYARARDAGVAPKDNLVEGRSVSGDRLLEATPHLRSAVRRQATSAATPGSEAATASLGVSQATLDAIASCESGGDPTAVSPDGTYRGKYQFDESTWASVGGSGDPAAAPAAEQDMRAAMLYSEVGSSAWPVCGQ
jgi:hypothetical protein